MTQSNDHREHLTQSITSHFSRHARTGSISSSTNLVPLADQKWLVALSARSALDLYLQVKKYPRNTYVLMSAINIPDLSIVLKHHGLIPYPIDLDIPHLSPRVDHLQELLETLTPRVSCVLVAHIFGRRFETDAIAKLTIKYKVDLIEDAAEAFRGFDFVGHPAASLAFFSFGSIKATTGFGGGVARVRDQAVFEKMNQLQQSYPLQDRSIYAKKIIAGFAAGNILESGMVMRMCRRWEVDPKPHVVSMLRGFSGDLVPRLRTQPSTPLLYMLARRFERFDLKDYMIGIEKAELFCKLLPRNVFIPGRDLPDAFRHHWLFPMVVDHPDKAEVLLNEHGVLCYRGATQLNLVEPPTQQQLRQEHQPLSDTLPTPVLSTPQNPRHNSFYLVTCIR